MFKHRVARNRALYFAFFLSVIVIFAFAIDMKWEFYQLVLIAMLFLIPGRVVQFFWEEFFEGKRRLQERDFDGALTSFEAFLEKLRQRRWLKWLMFLSYGLYSFRIEAVVLTQMALASIHKKQYGKARDHLRESLRCDTRYCFAFYHEAVVNLLEGNMPAAEDSFRQAREHGYPRMAFEEFVEITHDTFGKV